MAVNKYLLLALFFAISIGFVKSQDLLEKRISIKISSQPLDETLKKLGDAGNFSFSYSPDIIDIKSKVSIQADNQSIREILTELFKGKVTFRAKRKYIILQKADIPEPDENFDLNGYIIDNKTGRKLANASIYETATLASTVSNQFGYYKIRLPVVPGALRLEVRKEDYIGKSISVSNRKDTFLHIRLNPDTLQLLSNKLTPREQSITDSLHRKVVVPKIQLVSHVEMPEETLPDTQPAARDYARLKQTYQKVQNNLISAFASAKQAIHTRNISDTLHRHYQASILPFFGTNHELSGNVINTYSLNLIAGYSLGVSTLEVGGILNVVRGNVNGFQLAGVSNIVGNNVTGFQYANVLNITLGNFQGFQGSNLINYTGRNFSGFQVAGVGNVVVGNLDGYQLSAGYNYANTVRSGHQIGFINYADSSATVPFGLFSYVYQNGYRRFEFSTDEFNYFNTAFKTGVSRFYNIFSLGFNGMSAEKPLGTIGYGFGTAQNLGKGWMVNADLTGNVVLFKDQEIDEINAGLFKFSASIEKKLGRKLALFAGPSINLLTGNESGRIRNGETNGIKPFWLGRKRDQSKTGYSWVGFQAGIRFCN
ncbi:STN and carboxypeptidase regulatory-like domain-containing protein [Dyadobacter sp. CY323]|uniref:STN and carboxypeptidase regulatory-like domain-containing protein n=1 Tax=Dyadobacter sp. CY323 TaxID=2907302 RepID=UPI001F3CC7F1|nr:STN and carboxypeptidase regulatory-like domain-containing protein [Dyadobacter sp. CY323]MCE6990345.1 hypothetical protein [Dyadobacter sp. CY323]